MKESIIRERSFDFALSIIVVCRKLQAEREYVLSRQLLKSGTSIGANVEEALAGQSRNDFHAKMSIASKEARETKYWLRLIDKSHYLEEDLSNEIEEITEIILILTSIVKSTGEDRR